MDGGVLGHTAGMNPGSAQDRPPEAAASEPPPTAAVALEFTTVYGEHFAFVWRCLRRLGVSEHSLDDAAQEVFLTVHRRLAEFEGRSSLKTWLFGIVVNVVRHHRRTLARKGPLEPLPDAVADVYAPSPHDLTVKSEAARLLHQFLDALDDDKRAVFVLVDLEQWTAPEVSAATGANLHTVYSRLRSARLEFEQFVARTRARDPWRAP